MCIYTYTYIHLYMYNMYMYTHKCVYVHTYIHVYVCYYVYLCLYIHVCMYVYVYMCTQNMNMLTTAKIIMQPPTNNPVKSSKHWIIAGLLTQDKNPIIFTK